MVLERRGVGVWMLVLALVVGCLGGGRDVHDVAMDFEGAVGSGMVERLLRNVDLVHHPLVVSIAGEPERRFGHEGQRALEDALGEWSRALEGDVLAVVQEVAEERGGVVVLTLTLRVRTRERERYVPVAVELVRSGRRLSATRVRVMLAARRGTGADGDQLP